MRSIKHINLKVYLLIWLWGCIFFPSLLLVFKGLDVLVKELRNHVCQRSMMLVSGGNLETDFCLECFQGRPKGVTPKYSLKPLVPRLSELLGIEVCLLNCTICFGIPSNLSYLLDLL